MSKYQVMPPLSADEYEELKADIQARGVLVPVEYDESGEILDGHHRVRICEELGITEWPRVVRLGLSEAGKLTHARQLNLARRHLDREQKRALIAQQLRETPQLSNRQIAASLGVDHKTVAAEREQLESIGEIPQCDRETSDGRTYPAQRQEPERPTAYRYVDPTRIAFDRGRVSRIRWGEKANGDGTHFCWFDVTTFPSRPPILIASSHPLGGANKNAAAVVPAAC